MLASCGSDIKYLEWPGCKVRNTYKNAGSTSSTYFRCLSWCSSGRKIATIPDGNYPIVIDPNELEDYKGLKYQEIQVPRVNTLAFSKKSPHLLSMGCETGHIFQYDTRDESIHIVSSLPSPVNLVRYGIGDETLAASCGGGQIYLFNSNEKLTSTYFVPRSWSVSAMALHPSERNVLCGASKEGIVAVWDSSTGNLKFQTHDHQSEVTGLAFSPSDWLLASTSTDYSLNIYDLRMRERVFYKMFNQKLSTVAFPTQGNYFVVGNQHGRAMTFDKRKLSVPKASIQVHEGPIRQFAFQNENAFEQEQESSIKVCQSETSFKTPQNTNYYYNNTNLQDNNNNQKKGSGGDAGDQLIDFDFELDSTSKDFIFTNEELSEESLRSYSQQQALLGAQEEICKCTEETLKSFVREMNDRFLQLWMSINKDLAKLENRSEMRWKKFHAMIFDLGSSENSAENIISVGSQTTQNLDEIIPVVKPQEEEQKTRNKRTFNMF